MSNGPTTPFKTSTNSSTHSNKSGVEPPRFNFSNVSSNNHFYAARVPEQDASKYSLYALKELHKYQHSLCIGLNYLHCSIEIIDAIVPKWKPSHHGQFDPPASFRSSEQRLKTWRRHTTSQQRQLIQGATPTLLQETDTDLPQKRVMSAVQTPSATTDLSEHQRCRPTRSSSRRKADAPRQVTPVSALPFSDITNSKAAGLAPRQIAASFQPCVGLTIEDLVVDGRTSKDYADANIIKMGYQKLAGQATHNKGTAISQDQPWPISDHIPGALFDATTGQVSRYVVLFLSCAIYSSLVLARSSISHITYFSSTADY
jgi:hypothetical protein